MAVTKVPAEKAVPVRTVPTDMLLELPTEIFETPAFTVPVRDPVVIAMDKTTALDGRPEPDRIEPTRTDAKLATLITNDLEMVVAVVTARVKELIRDQVLPVLEPRRAMLVGAPLIELGIRMSVFGTIGCGTMSCTHSPV